jgi:hypothetical protein
MKPVLIPVIIIVAVLCTGCTTPVEESSYSVYTPAVTGTLSPSTPVTPQVSYGALSYSSNRPAGISVSLSKIDTQIMLYYYGGPDAAGLSAIETVIRNSDSEEYVTTAKRPVPGDEIPIRGGTNGLDYATVIATFSDGSHSLLLDTYV